MYFGWEHFTNCGDHCEKKKTLKTNLAKHRSQTKNTKSQKKREIREQSFHKP